MKKYLAEATGTFALVFAGCGAIVVDETGIGSIGHLGISAVFGLIIMIMIYSFGNVSGAHFNPAVTLGFLAAGRISPKDSLFYAAAQTAGGILAALFLSFLFPAYLTLGVTVPSGSVWQSFALEAALTFMLMLVILNVSTGHMEKGMMAGIAIGAMVFVGAAVGGPVSGASMNPARSLAPAVVSGEFGNIWIYLTSPFAGAVLALPLFNIIQRKNIL